MAVGNYCHFVLLFQFPNLKIFPLPKLKQVLEFVTLKCEQVFYSEVAIRQNLFNEEFIGIIIVGEFVLRPHAKRTECKAFHFLKANLKYTSAEDNRKTIVLAEMTGPLLMAKP